MKTYFVLPILILGILLSSNSRGQVGINSTSIVTNISISGASFLQTVRSHGNSVNTVNPSTNYVTNFLNLSNTKINSFTSSGKSYVQFDTFDTIIFRRVANAWETTNGNKQQIFVEGTAVNNVTHALPYNVGFPTATGYAYMQKVLKDGYINRGTDNLFNNDSTSDLTYSNIERADFVVRGGNAATIPALAGFLITERGGNDGFKIAAILGIDANGNPTSFGPVLTVASNAYGNTVTNIQSHVLRKDASDNSLRPFSTVSSQSIKAVFIRYSDLGVAANQRIYGYAMMGTDVTATTSAQLLNFTSSTYFPRTTTAASGGIDLASAPGIYHTDVVLSAHMVGLSVESKNCVQNLKWSNNDYNEVKSYEVERSADGINFEVIAGLNNITTAAQTWTDNSGAGASYYRIRVTDNNGQPFYSKIIHAGSACRVATITAFPNPAKDNMILSLEGVQGSKEIAVYALTGKLIKSLQLAENTSQLRLDLAGFTPGHYLVKIQNQTGFSKTLPFIKL